MSARTVVAPAQPTAEAGTGVGRRGFVGALAGTVGTVLSAQQAAPAATTPGGAAGRVLRSPAGTVCTELRVALPQGGLRLLVPAAFAAGQPGDLVWVHAAGAAAERTAFRCVDHGIGAALVQGDPAEAARWVLQHAHLRSSVLHGAGGAGAAAIAAALHRSLPRIAGVHLVDPPADAAWGPAVLWAGRRVRLVTGTASALPDLATTADRLAGYAEESTAAVAADPTDDLLRAVARWRTAS